ncbi:MAG TPA: SDR family oxidoreductase [Gemmatimonadales bacterium]|nr:SDR family oxidoreductase [Gemmatimonadales bacterium]
MKGRALVTGASSGIGLELAKLFAAGGYDLVLVARRRDELAVLGADLTERHRVACEAIAMDLAASGAAATLAQQLNRGSAGVDVLVNNAGFGALGEVATMDVETVRRMIQLNVGALTELTRLVLPGMLARGHGRIMNVASTAGFVPGPFMAVYYATKAYVISFSEALAEELRGSGVTVTVLCPGPTRTEFQAVAKMGSARLMKLPGVMDAAPVARAGYAGLMAGKRMVVPGFMNRMLPFVIRFSPRGLVVRVSRIFQQSVRG